MRSRWPAGRPGDGAISIVVAWAVVANRRR